jgi:hypothetical protein
MRRTLPTIAAWPVCSLEEANQPPAKGGFRGLRLGSKHYDLLVRESCAGVVDGIRKYVYLRNVLRPEGSELPGSCFPNSILRKEPDACGPSAARAETWCLDTSSAVAHE